MVEKKEKDGDNEQLFSSHLSRVHLKKEVARNKRATLLFSLKIV